MRKMLLSFKPSVYDKIYAGIKIFEHRRNFPNEPIMLVNQLGQLQELLCWIIGIS